MSQVELQTSKGKITIELDAAKAPESARNFLEYVRAGHYDNTVFHRVIRGFMIQGGGFEPGMKQKPTQAPIRNEANNGLKNLHYTLAMARTNDPHSATAQFFINATDNAFLVGRHAAELRGPQYERLLQQAALLQIGEQGSGRLIKDRAMPIVIVAQRFVGVPIQQTIHARRARGAVQIHVAHTALQQPPRQQAVPCVRGFERIAVISAVQTMDGRRLG